MSVYFVKSQNYSQIATFQEWEILLKRIAVLRWGNDESKFDIWINTLRNTPHDDCTSFILFAIKGRMDMVQNKIWENIKLMGFAYFCQDETDKNQWHCRNFVVHPKYSGRMGIFRRLEIRRHPINKRLFTYWEPVSENMINQAMYELRDRKATKLFAYLDRANKSSILLHEKFSFKPSENQNNINGFNKDDRIMYERIL